MMAARAIRLVALSACALALVAGAARSFPPTPPARKAASFTESFAGASKDVTRGYRSFVYQSTLTGCKAEARGGRLILRGDHDEGDQRLAVTARKALGTDLWPDVLEVSVKLGGTAQEDGAWHVGVSVGRIKVLFHPAYEGGAFRFEDVDKHTEYIGNESMGFTPAADALHPMTVKVRQVGQRFRFDVTVTDAKGGGKFTKSFTATAKQVGNYDRVGLERSGRRGGDALFEALTIRPGK